MGRVKKPKLQKINLPPKNGIPKRSRRQPKTLPEPNSGEEELNEALNPCKRLTQTTYVVNANHVACISLNKINELLDKDSAEVCRGVFVAPLFRGRWGAFAQIQIEPGMSHGPYLNTAQFMVGRVAAAREDAEQCHPCLEISFDTSDPRPLHQDSYFQIPSNTVYALHNRSASHPVVISLQLFDESSSGLYMF